MDDILELDRAYRRFAAFLDRTSLPLARCIAAARFLQDLPTEIRGRSFYEDEIGHAFVHALEELTSAPADPELRDVLQLACHRLRESSLQEQNLTSRLEQAERKLLRNQGPPNPEQVPTTARMLVVNLPGVQKIPSFLRPDRPPDHLGVLIRVAIVARGRGTGERQDHWVLHGASAGSADLKSIEDVSATALVAGREGARAFLAHRALRSPVVPQRRRAGVTPTPRTGPPADTASAGVGFDLSITDLEVHVAGESAGLGLATVFGGVLAGVCGGDMGLAPLPRLAWTGRVDPSGAVAAVSAESLRAKVRAAAFGGLAGIIVPSSQVEHARGLVPEEHRDFQVHGVDHVAAALDNPDLVGPWALPEEIRPQEGRGPTSRRSPIRTAALALASVAAIVLVAHFGPSWRWASTAVDEPLSYARVELRSGESVVQGFSKSGIALWEWSSNEPVQVPVDEIRTQLPLAVLRSGGTPIGVLVTTRPPAGNSQAFFLDAKTGRARWAMDLSAELPARPRMGRWVSTWQAAVAWGDRGDSVLAVCLVEDKYSPTCVQFLNSRGVLVGAYYHPGHLYYHSQVDVDQDGLTEILLYGYNNPLRDSRDFVPFETNQNNPGCAILLRPPRVQGQAYPYRSWAGLPPAEEVGYLVIPPLVPDLMGVVNDWDVGQTGSAGKARIDLGLCDGRILTTGPDLRPQSCFLPENTKLAAVLGPSRRTFPVVHISNGHVDTVQVEIR